MAKREKNGAKSAVAREKPAAGEPAASVPHPPRKNLALLLVSMVLFAAWFVFLLVTALAG